MSQSSTNPALKKKGIRAYASENWPKYDPSDHSCFMIQATPVKALAVFIIYKAWNSPAGAFKSNPIF